jgi:hypothetical protein
MNTRVFGQPYIFAYKTRPQLFPRNAHITITGQSIAISRFLCDPNPSARLLYGLTDLATSSTYKKSQPRSD